MALLSLPSILMGGNPQPNNRTAPAAAPAGGAASSSAPAIAPDSLKLEAAPLGRLGAWLASTSQQAVHDVVLLPAFLRSVVTPSPASSTPAAPASNGGGASTVTVQPGDTLMAIAQKTLGSASRWQEIYNLNQDQISNPNLIFPGQTFKLPATTASTPASAQTGTASPAAASGTYTVKPGDTVMTIAQKTLGSASRWQELYAANRDQLSDPNLLFPGTVLQIPSTPAATPTPASAPAQASAPGGSSFGDKAVAAARQLMANGYHYTVNLTTNYHPVRFQVGCCADFAVDSWAKAGIDLYNKVSNPHYCPSLVSYFKSGKDGHQWISKSQACKPGDMVFFDWGDGQADHVAIVSAVGPDGKPSKIVESYNFNLPVHEITLGSGSKNCIIGYGRA